jgi:hypothetical protein
MKLNLDSHILSPPELIEAVHDNLRNLDLERFDAVNLRIGERLRVNLFFRLRDEPER